MYMHSINYVCIRKCLVVSTRKHINGSSYHIQCTTVSIVGDDPLNLT